MLRGVLKSLPSFLLRLAAATVALSLAGGAVAAVAVKDIRVWAGPDATRLVLDLSAPTDHRLMTLKDPDRVVIDIPAATIERADRAWPSDQGFLRQLRVGPQGNGDLRLVIDLAAPASPRAFAVGPNGAYGHRLVVDLEPGAVSSNGANGAASSTGAASTASVAAPATVPAKPPSVVKSARDVHGRDIIVAIDAGHGGVDPGSIGKRGTREKDVTLAIARRLKERIDREPGMRAVLTRDNDQFVEHRERIRRARVHQADMFVSVHADAYHDRSVVGSSVYVLSARGASDESARWLADRENAADLIGGVKLDDKDSVLASVLLDLSQGASMSASLEAADKVMDELYSIGNITRRGVKSAGFLVLKSPDIPSILVETAFISNPTEESRLIDSRHQLRLAEAIHRGVRKYFYANPPPGTLVAELRARGEGRTVLAGAGRAGEASGASN